MPGPLPAQVAAHGRPDLRRPEGVGGHNQSPAATDAVDLRQQRVGILDVLEKSGGHDDIHVMRDGSASVSGVTGPYLGRRHGLSLPWSPSPRVLPGLGHARGVDVHPPAPEPRVALEPLQELAQADSAVEQVEGVVVVHRVIRTHALVAAVDPLQLPEDDVVPLHPERQLPLLVDLVRVPEGRVVDGRVDVALDGHQSPSSCAAAHRINSSAPARSVVWQYQPASHAIRLSTQRSCGTW